MITSTTNEQAFEALIEKALIGTTREERGDNARVDNQQPSKYYWGQPHDMDKSLAIDTRRLFSFINATQADMAAQYTGDLKADLPQRINSVIKTSGIIDVLRNGIDIENLHFTLFYPKPTAADSDEAYRLYLLNQFSLTRQQTFSHTNPTYEIDMVLFLNGLPIFTFELKNPWTHQTARVDGQKQYRSPARSPQEPLLQFGRCLAHFTLDKDEIYFTTRLNGEKTFFMPFNKGLPNGQGKGNPTPQSGYKTAYLWEEVLQKDCLADILQNYVLFDYGETKSHKKVPHTMKYAKRLIFPRYHQLDVVRAICNDIAQKGVGKTYLIQHSAGSGKSNSITWLAYILIGLCPDSNDAVRSKGVTNQLFDSVVIVTDRRLLDRQITDNVVAFGKSRNILCHADNSSELKNAIQDGKRIICTTIQKFPFIADVIKDVSDHNFAILIDEAHSSQSGIAADKMNASMQRKQDKDQESIGTDELLMAVMKDRKMSSNCTYVAFTATPKRETLERFGTKNAEGKFHPFHLYSMKQAIEEGFILDVLVNYTTYKSYYEVIKTVENNPEYEKNRAQKMIRQKVEREPQTIRAKAEEMLNHFNLNVYGKHRLNSKAKAMVLTKDIECAINYYLAICAIIQEHKLQYKALIAFSGDKNIDGKEVNEAFYNGFPETQTAEQFEGNDDYRILVVANKYITGFDQPKLCTMYIDKPLEGVLAVQALSRLNRAAPELGKTQEDIFILDFYNTVDGIKAAFDPFYTSTTLEQASDANILHETRAQLLSVGIFDKDDIEEFITLYAQGVSADQWAPIIDRCADQFNNDSEMTIDDKADFKIKCKFFVKTYSRIAAIIPYNVLDWEKMFWFLRFLIPQLIVRQDRIDISDLLDNVDLNTYGMRRTVDGKKIELDPEETTVSQHSTNIPGVGQEPESDYLDVIIKEFNEHWFKGWDATPEEQKTRLQLITREVVQDDEYREFIVGNPDTQAVTIKLNEIISRIIRQQRKGDMTLYAKYMQDNEFKDKLNHVVAAAIEHCTTVI